MRAIGGRNRQESTEDDQAENEIIEIELNGNKQENNGKVNARV